MGKNKIGICVIGAGRAGRIHMKNFARSVPHARLSAVVDPSEEAAASAQQDFEIPGRFLSYKDALLDKDVDAVVAVSPTVYHKEIVVAAAQAGKHILCEKPMAMNVAEARNEFPDFYDNVVMNASFANGMQGVIDGAVSVKYGYDARVEVLGTRGILFVGQLNQNSVVTCSKAKGMVTPVIASWRNLFEDAYLRENTDFVQCIREDREPAVTGVDGMMAVKVVNAGNVSIKSRRPVGL